MLIPVEKGKKYTIKIKSETGYNEGIGHVDSFPIYVKKAKIGEKLNIKIIDIKKHYAIGRWGTWREFILLLFYY